MQERRAVAAAPPEAVEAPPAATRKLQIVVDDHPPPSAAPIEVLAANRGAVPAASATPLGLSLAAKAAAPVSAPATPSHPLIPPRAIEAVVPAITGTIAAAGLAIARAEAPPPGRATTGVEPIRLAAYQPEAKATAKVRVSDAPLDRAKDAGVAATDVHAGKARAAKIAAAKLEAAKFRTAKVRAARVQLAKAQAAQAHRLELAETARAKAAAKASARAEKAEQIRLAEAEAKGRAEAREEARQEALADARKRARLAAIAHVLARALPHRAAPSPPLEMAKLEHRRARRSAHEPKVEQAALKSRRGHEAAHLAAAHPARARPEPVAPQAGSGLMKVSVTRRCASRDPGEALVCADPSLGAADRQLARAYQGARAAGVPDAQLRSQQQRWLAARSAAAREAPWAVRDVYMARIAELNGQAKDAQEGY